MKIGKGDAISIAGLFKDELQYRIPRYQRRYIWDETNWKVLWEDITRFLYAKRKDKKHFTGTIVTLPDEISFSQPLKTHEIIDGQQRLTTFQVIFCAIRDIATSSDRCDSSLENKIKGLITLPEYEIGREKKRIEEIANNEVKEKEQNEFSCYRFVPKGHDRIVFESMINGNTSRLSGGIVDAYVYFKKVITDYLKTEEYLLEHLMDILLSKFHVVQIELERGDDPEKIFESINDTGRALDEFDYLWNHLFLRTRKLEQRSSDDLYEQHWKKFEESTFWDSAKRRDMFFQAFLMAKWGPKCFVNEERIIKAFDLYREYSKTIKDNLKYKEKLRRNSTLSPVEYEFKQLSCYADSYQELHDLAYSSGISSLREIAVQMQFDPLNLQRLDSFILFLKHESELTDEELSEVLDILKSYIVRRMICAKRNEDIYEKINEIFSGAIKSTLTVKGVTDALLGSWPDPNGSTWIKDGKGGEVQEALKQACSKDNNLILYILYEIEIYKGGDRSALTLNDLTGPEPIISESLSNYYALDCIGNLMPFRQRLDPEEYPCDSSFNKSYLKACGADLKLTEEICQEHSWDENQIDKRTEDLLNCFDKIWKPWNVYENL